MNKKSLIYVAGHKGLVGSEILKKLKDNGYENIITKTHKELDLTNQKDTKKFFKEYKPEYVFLAAAKVGGILGNKLKPAEYIYDNIQIQTNVIHFSYKYNVKKLLFLGSSCIYPKYSKQPIKEDYLLSDYLESSNIGYAISKIAGIIMCNKYNYQYDTKFISLMPTNLYGSISDNYDLETSHVLPALIRKFHDAKINNKPSVKVWGTGEPMREFLHVSDMADASIYCMLHYIDYHQHVNIGTGKDISIKDLSDLIKNIIGYNGKIEWDISKPYGTPKKLLDVSKMNRMGWKYKIDIEEGIKKTYDELLKKHPLFK